jgi:hypothetical protein
MVAVTFSRKAWWLCALGGLTLALFMVGAALVFGTRPAELLEFQPIKEIFGIWVIGAVITGVFGIPCLAVIDKYFVRFSSRYMVGGAISAWIAWLAIAGPLFNPDRWNFDELINWVGSGLGHVGIYVGIGFTAGALLTLALWVAERRICPLAPDESGSTEAG